MDERQNDRLIAISGVLYCIANASPIVQ